MNKDFEDMFKNITEKSERQDRVDNYKDILKTLQEMVEGGFVPMAMLYRNEKEERDPEWVRFAWPWARPAAMYEKYKKAFAE